MILAFTKFGVYLIEDLHRVDKDTGDLTRKAMLLLSAYPIIESFVSKNSCLIVYHIGRDQEIRYKIMLGKGNKYGQ